MVGNTRTSSCTNRINGHANAAAAQRATKVNNGDRAPTLTNHHHNNHTTHTNNTVGERMEEEEDMEVADAADAGEEVVAEEAMAEEKRAPMEMCSRGSITSTIATRVAMTATTQDTNAPTLTAATTCPTSNVMRHIYMHIRVRAW